MRNVKMKLIIILICLAFIGGGVEAVQYINSKKPGEVFESMVCYSFDVNSYEALAGSADYVIIGEVLKEEETEYRNANQYWVKFWKKNEGTPYTSYRVQVLENLKGQLTQETPIILTKGGGVCKNGRDYSLARGDLLPIEGEKYVFYIYAQADGSNLVYGTNSTIPVDVKERKEVNTLYEFQLSVFQDETLLDKIRAGVENQVVSDRERSVSNDDVSVQHAQ